ncbi:MAG: sulfotransferase [Emcibacter sp.]|nr:sulfotransferase [Emcibacter sp.]
MTVDINKLDNRPRSQTPVMGQADVDKFTARGYQALLRRDFKEAGACCQLVLKYHPQFKGAHFLVGLIAIETKDWDMARHAFKNVVEIDPAHAAAWAQLARSSVSLAQYDDAEEQLKKAVSFNTTDPLVMDVIGNVYSLLGEQKTALEWFDKARETSKSAFFDLSRAKALTFLGHIDQARDALQSVLSEKPDSAMAHWSLARLEKATSEDHITIMSDLVQDMDQNRQDAPFLHYAIGKEWEDLEHWDKAFAAFEMGAQAKRHQINYDEASEIALFDSLEKNLNKEWFSRVDVGHDDSSPIFIIGQPRTGTTLVERIITAHSEVAGAGELQQFAMAIKRAAKMSSPRPMTAEIIKKAATVNMREIGEIYMKTTRAVRPNSPYFVDKLPVNFMYAPLIAAALPKAKIIHIMRDPMDSCFSSYKQLFADAYFHSYNQGEMARHHIRYRRLMAKWRDFLGGHMLEINYEDVTSDLENSARKIIKFLGLEWQESCVNFYAQTAAVTTASAVQVREKAHTRSIGRWKEFEKYLDPMVRIIEDAALR